MGSLNRFLVAQDSRYDGYAGALEEIRAGQKRGHWIWYVFPQISGLGSSAASREFGIAGVDEASAYLREAMLGSRLLEITTAVAAQLRNGIPLPLLMGSEIDARKLVSSMTLFGFVARQLAEVEDRDQQSLADLADEILSIAAAQGYERCRVTERLLSRSR